jgi:hypothetical protein
VRRLRLLVRWYGAAAATHPVRWLRWLRDGMLTVIAVAGLLCLLVTYQAHREITAATGRAATAITEVNAAYTQLVEANSELVTSFHSGDVAIAGTGATYDLDITAASQDLVIAAGDNAAGANGAQLIQFADGLLGTYTGMVEQASTDSASGMGTTLPIAGLLSASGQMSSILAGLAGLRQAEQGALTADLGSQWLTPGDVWWLLLAPFFAMLLLAAGTSYALWRGFRRILSVRLTAALVLTLGLIGLVAVLNVHDAGQARESVTGPLSWQTDLTSAKAAHQDLGGQQMLREMVGVACPPDAPSICVTIAGDQRIEKAMSARLRPVAQAAGPDAAGILTSEFHTDAADTGFAYNPWTLAAGLVLAGAAAALVYAACRPRLEEYRYRP